MFLLLKSWNSGPGKTGPAFYSAAGKIAHARACGWPRCLLLRVAALILALAAAAPALAAPPAAALELLLSRQFDDKAEAVTLLGEAGDAVSATLLRALLDGNLYTVKADQRLVLVDRQERRTMPVQRVTTMEETRAPITQTVLSTRT